mmetsp:Transcript_5950/g.17035  ORF Transcript_5950/g.17035 Transcript_5950/m.17035 type:complete len:90 (+) Transcript_5950:1128-1397(+)
MDELAEKLPTGQSHAAYNKSHTSDSGKSAKGAMPPHVAFRGGLAYPSVIVCGLHLGSTSIRFRLSYATKLNMSAKQNHRGSAVAQYLLG